MAWFRLCLVLATVAAARPSLSAPVPPALSHAVPAGLQAGDRFHLLFVTRDGRNANSTDIADFNAFVNSAADSAGIGPATGSVDWFAVASTPAIHARDNAFVQAPVYNMQGELLASSFADMWDGALAAAVKFDEHATAIIPFHHVWTGSRKDGTAFPMRELGRIPTAEIGDLKLSNGNWLETSNAALLVEFHLYALSEPLVVVPEPAALAMIGCAIFGLVARRRPRRRR
jgi:hypothetical protein